MGMIVFKAQLATAMGAKIQTLTRALEPDL
jgi:hypothetical protein